MRDQAAVTAAEVARLAGVGRAAVGNWRRRHDDFPRPVGGSDTSPTFRLAEVRTWLLAHGKLGAHSLRELAWQELEAASGGSVAERLAVAGECLARGGLAADPESPLRQALDDLAGAVGAETAFEQLCARFVEAHSRHFAVTPPRLAELMVALAAPRSGPVLDPACGIGSLLRAASGAWPLLGQEVDPGLAALARARLAFVGVGAGGAGPARGGHRIDGGGVVEGVAARDGVLGGGRARVRVGDALRADAFPGVAAAAVLCNPPFNQRQWGVEELQQDPRWVYGVPARAESELAWVQHCLAHLRPGGRAVLVMPPGVASRRAGRPIRAELVGRGVLLAVVALPAGAAAPSHLGMHLWVLQQPGAAPGPPGVLLVDTTVGAPARLDELGWSAVAWRVREAWRAVERGGPGDGATHRVVPASELLADQVDLTPARHLRVAPDPAQVEPDRKRLAELLRVIGEAVPEVEPVAMAGDRPTTTVAELARHGAVLIRQQVGRFEVAPDGPGAPVLTVRDVIARRGPTGRIVGDEPAHAVRLRAGDVVVPAMAPHPVAVVVETAQGAFLGSNLQLLRPDPTRLDPWFLAGHLRSAAVLRAARSLAGAYRIDVRRVELPAVPLAEQRGQAEAFRCLAAFGAAVDAMADLGRELERALVDGIAAGVLAPGVPAHRRPGHPA